MSTLKNRLIQNRKNHQRNLTVFLNSGDPDMDTTVELLQICGDYGVDVIELGVSFANSFTDGATLIRSHERALANDVSFETVRHAGKARWQCVPRCCWSTLATR